MATTSRKDYYAVLGVPHDADQKTVKRAFRDLARTHHPDRSSEPDAQERFEEITEAYAVLSDPGRRSEYDRHGTASLDGISVEDLLAGLDLGDLFGGGGTPGFGEDDAWPGGFFTGRRGRLADREADIEIALTVPLTTVLGGGTGTVTVRRPGPCGVCGGSGVAPGTRPRSCGRCGGTGSLVIERRRGALVMRQVATCSACGGTGAVVERPCPACAGSGSAEQSESVTLRIPPGIAEGTALRLPGKGMPPPLGGGRHGDAFVVVRTVADPRFERHGADLWHTEEVTVPDAVLGTRLTVAALDGDVVLSVPPGTQPGTVLGIAGRGLPRSGSGHGRGDLRVRVDVRVPDRPGEEELRLYRQLRDLRTAPEPGPVVPRAAGGAAEPREDTAPGPEDGRDRWWRRWWHRLTG
ncbi:DnaJ C-terminal domain-containing protein [Kitasatospora terrestris]|uniref:Chaperone protein DnaJ n=1 Tax=Kitasatospora terrestris TaxID=258051 RepID=A0ABP9DDP3_9ACTN